MKKIILPSLVITVILSVSSFTYLSSTGKTFQTGSPFDGSYCSSCHGGGSTAPALAITSFPAFGTGNTYMPSATYTINVTCSGSYPKYGFDLEILNSTGTTSCMDRGVFGPVVSSNCKKVVTGGLPTNITHTFPEGSGNTATFSFSWTAPASGTAYLYCACVGANNNGSNAGDNSVKTNITLTPSLTAASSMDQNEFDVKILLDPENGSATINYLLKENADITMEIYDISGKKVGDLLKEKQNAGEHRYILNFRSMNLKSGIYPVMINTKNYSAIRKLIVE